MQSSLNTNAPELDMLIRAYEHRLGQLAEMTMKSELMQDLKPWMMMRIEDEIVRLTQGD